jgi:threonine/homoserine/homoserine lactone efflux protein
MMPGPLLAATIGESSRRGPAAGPLLIAGHAILETALVILLLLGLSPFLARSEVFAVVSLAGGGVLFWMAIGMFRALPGMTLSAAPAVRSRKRLVWTGAMLSLSNPYWTIWWATIGLGAILQSGRFGIPGAAAFFGGHVLGDLVWYTAVSYTVGRGVRLLTDRAVRILFGILAAAMAGFAVYFMASGAVRAGVRIL